MTNVLPSFIRKTEPFYLDVLLAEGVMSGITREVDESRRIVDLMNNRDEIVLLDEASMTSWDGRRLVASAEWLIEKRAILAVIPKETEEQKRHLRLERVGMARPQMLKVFVAAVLPPYVVRGTTYVQPGASLLRAHSDVFNRFFPLIDAELRSMARDFEAAIVVVNRDFLSAMARLDPEQEETVLAPRPRETVTASVESLVAEIESETSRLLRPPRGRKKRRA